MSIRRASEGRTAAATSLIDEHLSSLPVEDQLGDASRAYWAMWRLYPVRLQEILLLFAAASLAA
ncbi:hypothetical protein PPTG_12037 [Phytophthora nicotianae INRA-310]|uniref:Uncharacterized protein n=1 Tax=Phytophthora nicotianae (strain INRA-310) TaxID=761204 RepID=W2Q4S4_PHYN3|nr:hypothetical protein PPTG_12037 [Phytophthora nicotianae INRA-310]ETN08193.1 hypothetical protein PPTG_12037 [Phytophthora nicotianae INRA-310]